MNKFYLLSFIAFAILFNNPAYSQQTDSLKQTHIDYIVKHLAVSKNTAQQVISIMDKYKQDAKAAINDKNLKGEKRKMKLDQLMEDKNSKLKKILTETQFQKIVPTTERTRS